MLSSLVLSVYFISLVGFAFVSHPVLFCGLLILNVLCVIGSGYLLLGFSWYMVLLCLVYVGGVYVLFIFVLVHNPNPTPPSWVEAWLVILLWVFVSLLMMWSGGISASNSISEHSYYLCNIFEGFTYCVLCLVVLLGFTVVSLVVSRKDSFFR